MRRLERKELERIARRFRVITPAEFEKNMAAAGELNGAEGCRPNTDSWAGGAGDRANGASGVANANGDRPDTSKQDAAAS